MREIKSNKELNLIKLEERGFVLNERPDRRKAHHVTCESVTATTVRHPKYFFETRRAAKKWIGENWEELGWENCGYCKGIESPRS